MKIKIFEPKKEFIHVIEGNITIPRRLRCEIEIDDTEISEILKQIVEMLNSGWWHA